MKEIIILTGLLAVVAGLLYVMYCQVHGNCGGSWRSIPIPPSPASGASVSATAPTHGTSWWRRNREIILWIVVVLIVAGAVWHLMGKISTLIVTSGMYWFIPMGLTLALLIWRALRVTEWNRYHIGTMLGLLFVTGLGGATLVPQTPEMGWLVVTGLVPVAIALVYAFSESDNAIRGVAYATLGSVIMMFTYIILLSQGMDEVPALVLSSIVGGVLAALAWFGFERNNTHVGNAGMHTNPLVTIDTTGRRSGSQWVQWVLVAILGAIILLGLMTYLDGGMGVGSLGTLFPKILLGLLIIGLLVGFYFLPTGAKLWLLGFLGIALVLFLGYLVLVYGWYGLKWLYALIGSHPIAFLVTAGLIWSFITRNWNINGFIGNLLLIVAIIGAMSVIFGFPFTATASWTWPSWPGSSSAPTYTDPGWTR